MPQSPCTLGLLLIASFSVGAQPIVIDPTHQPDDFSKIVGKYSIKASAAPAEVHVEEAITLRIEITGEGPAQFEPKFKDLRLFPAYWKDDFYVQESPEEREVLRDKKTWVFVYRLKPKHGKVKEIGDIRLCYYDPQSTAKIKYVTKFAEPAITLKVTPKPDRSGDKIVDIGAAPASFYQRIESSRVLAAPTTVVISEAQLGLLLAAPPLACLIGAVAWRRWFPDKARKARQHRDNSAARAIAHLRGSGASAWDAVRLYLRERFDFAATDATPMEVAAFLKRRGFAKAVDEQARAFFQACDAVRFNAGATAAQPLADNAVCLIEALEADPCARG
jgi:hypothetical protein